MTIYNVEVQDYQGNIYYPHTSSSVVKHGNTTSDKVIDSKVGWTNDSQNPKITLFGECSIDATTNNGTGKGTVIRLKIDNDNYYLVGPNDARIYLNGGNIATFKKDYKDSTNAFIFKDSRTSSGGVNTYHNFFGNSSSGLKFLSTSAMIQARDGNDTNYADLRVKDLYYINLAGSSDINLKENIKYIKTNDSISQKEIYGIDLVNETSISDITELDMYNLINKINLYNFDYIDAENSNTIGFMAQHIQNDRVGKKLVKEDIDGNLCFNLYSYISCLTGALKEEVRKREALETKLEKIVNGIENLKN